MSFLNNERCCREHFVSSFFFLSFFFSSAAFPPLKKSEVSSQHNMTDETRETIRAFSQDRQAHHQRKSSVNVSSSTMATLHPTGSRASRRPPDIVSLISLSNQRFDDHGKQIYQAAFNNRNDFHGLNYSLRSPSLTPIHNFPSLENMPESKQPTLPTLTPRVSVTEFENIEIHRSVWFSRLAEAPGNFQISNRIATLLFIRRNGRFLLLKDQATLSLYRKKKQPQPKCRWSSKKERRKSSYRNI